MDFSKLRDSARGLDKVAVVKAKIDEFRNQSIRKMVQQVAVNTANKAEDLVGPTKLGYYMMKELSTEQVEQEAIDNVEEIQHYKRPKTWKTTKKEKGSRVIGFKEVVIDGQKVKVKVLDEEKEYYVGKSAPSGLPSKGTNAKNERDYERIQNKRLLHYLENRMDLAAKSEEEGRSRKGGGSEEYSEALENLEQVIEVEEPVVKVAKVAIEKVNEFKIKFNK